jgi:hypothetical protein
MDRNNIIQIANEALLCQTIWIDEPDCMALESIILFAELIAKAKAEEIAIACERLPFGDTAQSFATWIREQ